MTSFDRVPLAGDVRELENFIERAVILSPGADLHVPLSDLKPLTGNSTNGAKTLEGIEREHILKILRQTNWIIGGRAGAAMHSVCNARPFNPG